MIRKITFRKCLKVLSSNLNEHQKKDFDYYCSIFRMPDPFIIKKGDFLTPTPDSKFSDVIITTYGVDGRCISMALPSYVSSYLQSL